MTIVQKLRVQRGWSQEQLAEVSGLSVRTVQRVERGQTASVETLKALGAAFDVAFSDLQTPDGKTDAMTTTSTLQPAAAGLALQPEEALALARVRSIGRFYRHAMIYAVAVLIAASAAVATGHSGAWVLRMAGFWGLGLGWHGLRAFDKVPFLNGAWEKRQTEKILGRRL